MTKGKYAARAARRREDESVQTEIETCQRQVARLTAEAGELTGKLAAERAARKQEVRRLAAQLEEGLSPEVAALREELERQRRRADEAEADQRRVREKYDRQFDGLCSLLTDGLGLSGLEAVEVVMMLDPEARAADGGRVLHLSDAGGTRPGQLTGQQLRGVQTARGYRHRGDVVQLLRDKLDGRAARS